MLTAHVANSGYNSIDYFILTIFGLSILLGYMRGLLVEVISLGTLVVATFVSSMFSGKIAATLTTSGANAIQGMMNSSSGSSSQPISMIAVAGSFVGLFIATLIGGFIVKTIVVGVTQGAVMSLSNRAAGALFGVIRGFLLTLITMFVLELTPVGSQPAWAASQFVQSFDPYVRMLDKVVAPGLEMVKTRAQAAIQGMGGQINDMKGMFQNGGSQALTGFGN